MHRPVLRAGRAIVFAGIWSGILLAATPVAAEILWSDLGTTLAYDSHEGIDILGGTVRRDDTASDTLYFKFHVDPLSDVSTEEYFAAFQLYEKNEEHLGLGNSLKAWAYSAFNTTDSGEYNKVYGDVDLRSLRPEPASTPGVPLPYELPRRGIENTIVFKVKYVAGQDDEVTVWLNPDLRPGATEADQPEGLITRLTANAAFDQIRLRHQGGGGGWSFSDMAIATSFDDFVRGQDGDLGVAEAGGLPGESRMTLRTWQREQGLPQNAVRALAQTPDGYLWVGSDDGVARFDGVRFVPFGTREGLSSGLVRVLLTDQTGTLWVGTTGGGLSRLERGRFIGVQDGNELGPDTVTALGEDSQGQIWVGTEAGLHLVRSGRMAPWAAAKIFAGKTITTIYRDRRGGMWVGVRGMGIFRFLEGAFVQLQDTTVDGLLKDPHCLLVDRNERIWVGAGDDYVLCREANEWRRYRIPRHLSRPYIKTLAEEADGTVWAGSVREGVFEFKAGRQTAIDASSGLSDNFVEALLVDQEGNLWVGTGAGLSRLRRSQLTAFGQHDGLGYGPVHGLAELMPGQVWAGKPGDGLYSWQGRSFGRVPTTDPLLRNANVGAILAAQDGSCWVASAQGILHCKSPLAPDVLSEPAALPEKDIVSLAEDGQGRIWAGTRDGELWWRPGTHWERLTNLQPAHAISAIVAAPDGSMWVGTGGSGVFQWRAGGIKVRCNRSHGLLSDQVKSLHLDAANVLWIGTESGGLARLAQGQVNNFTTREGLPDNSITQILEDDAGQLWLGSRRGIAGVSKRNLAAVAAGGIAAVYPQIYGRTEGMPAEECVGGFFPSGLRTKSGLLWFPCLKGIVVVNPRRRPADPPPIVMIEDVVVDEAAVDFQRQAATSSPGPAAPLLIAPGKRRIEFHFTGIGFAAPERIRFRYQLEGLDPNWVEAGGRRTAFYSYLPPGDYRFRVMACNSAGVWNETGAALALRVKPHFYQTVWFLGAAALGFVALVGGAVRLGVKRKLQRRLLRLEQERALERERTRIAQDLHDDLGSSLTRLSLLSDMLKEHKTEPEEVAARAAKISQTSTQTVRALEEIVWALRPGSDTVQGLIEYIAHFAKELFEGDPTQCRLELPDEFPAQTLPPEMRHNIFLIVKEALTNAFKHAHAREVRVQARVDETGLELLVADDGKGCQLPIPPETGARNGLGNMQRRAASMGGVLKLESQPGQGTRVSIRIRFPAPSHAKKTSAAATH